MSKYLEVSDLSKHYKNFSLHDINFSIEKGHIVGFVGINGAGKTTTIKACAGLIKPNTGKIKFFGEEMNHKNEVAIRNRIGFVFDNEYTYAGLTIKEMKQVIAPAFKNWDNNKFKHYIERFNLPLDQKIEKLSKGMRTKLSLAFAFSYDAELLILDEPSSGLDPQVRTQLNERLVEYAALGKSILLSSHITSDLEKIIDELIIIHNGAICLNENYKAFQEQNIIIRLPSEKVNDAIKAMFSIFREKDNYITGICKNEFYHKMDLQEIQIIPTTIETIMLLYTQQILREELL